MIYTLTANPSLDYIMRVDHFELGATNRATSCELYPGGKGINVSTILERLDLDNTALGFLAGFSGRELLSMLEGRQFKKDFTFCKGITRINVKLKSGTETEINGSGLALEEKDIQALQIKIASLKESDTLILSGSVPAGCSNHFYADLMKAAPTNMLTAVDTTGEQLMNTLPDHPFLIKPNQDELEEIAGHPLTTIEELARAAQQLQKAGAKNVLVSRGAKGALLAGEDGRIYLGGCPSGKLVNSVGSGDSMVAGFMAGYIKTGDLSQALYLGLCCGSATAFSADLASKEDIEALCKATKKDIEIIELGSHH